MSFQDDFEKFKGMVEDYYAYTSASYGKSKEECDKYMAEYIPLKGRVVQQIAHMHLKPLLDMADQFLKFDKEFCFQIQFSSWRLNMVNDIVEQLQKDVAKSGLEICNRSSGGPTWGKVYVRKMKKSKGKNK